MLQEAGSSTHGTIRNTNGPSGRNDMISFVTVVPRDR